MSSLKERDDFLKRVYSIAKDNNKDLSYDEVYHLIVFNGISNEDKRIDLSNTSFVNWINHFKNRKTSCFVSPTWKYFCQFINLGKGDYPIDAEYSELKIYIPLKAEYVDEGGKRIFDFLDKNNIKHHSKIGKKIRVDNVVVRLYNKEDAKRFTNFIKHDKWFRGKLNKPSVFAYEEDGIGYGVDGRTSYNSCVACYVSMYINYCRENHLMPNIEHFYKYVENYYNLCFRNRNNTYDLVKEFASNVGIDEEDVNESLFVDYKRITELILKLKKPNFNMNDFISHYDLCNNRDAQEKEINFFKGNDNSISDEVVNNLLMGAYNTMLMKYGKATALNQMRLFVTGNDYDKITRTDGYRDKFINNKLLDCIKNICRRDNIKITDYVMSKCIDDTKTIEKLYFDCSNLIANVYNSFRSEYSHEQKCLQIRDYLNSNFANYITNNNGARQRVIEFDLYNKFRILNSYYNMNVDQLLSYMIDGYRTEFSIKR